MDVVSPVLRLLFIFALLVALIRVRVHLAVAMAISAFPLGMIFGLDAGSAIKVIGQACILPETLLLAAIILGIIVLSRLMREHGALGKMVESFSRIGLGRRAAVAFFPALIGFLPMPGGAAFSAPMVEESARGSSASSETLSLSNYWFRHIHEYWWPLYPGPILTMAIMGIPLGVYILGMLPLSATAVAAGVVLYLRRVPEGERAGHATGSIRGFFRTLSSLGVVVGSTIAGQVVEAFHPDLLGGWSLPRVFLVVGLLIAWLMEARTAERPLVAIGRILFTRDVVLFVAFAFAIMTFKETMTASGAVAAIRDELSAFGIPFAPAVAVMAFLVGIVTGITAAYVGTTFPLVAAATHGLPVVALLGYTAFVYSWGFMGTMLSPVHLCFILTSQHFKTNLAAQLARVVPAAVAVMLVGVATYLVLV